MGFQFGVGTLSVLENRGLNVVSTDLSALTTTMTGGANRSVMIDGVTAIWSAQIVSLTALLTTGEGATGTGLLYYLYIAAGSTVTGTVGKLTAGHPLNTASNLPTAIAPLFKFSFGSAASVITTIAVVSGGSATRTISRVQNVNINVSYETAQMRGGYDVFPADTKFFNGACEGSFEFAEQTAIQLLFLGGVYSSAGAASGTWTLSGNSFPNSVSLIFQNLTDGLTSTYRIHKAYLTQAAFDFSRTDYTVPSFNFVSQANFQGTTLQIEG